jgi:ectoine hydroxylase-related dioxygenase (phytanoyl-CoA dioxygenase family)
MIGSVAAQLAPSQQTRRKLEDWNEVVRGIWNAEHGQETPRSAHVALMSLFMESGGRANDRLATMVGLAHPPYRLPAASGVLGNLTKQDLRRIESQLERDGYYVFENCLSAEFCEQVIKRTLAVDCYVVGDEIAASGNRIYARYERGAAKAPMYVLRPDDTADIQGVQQLMSDPSLLAVSQNYMKSKPIISAAAMSWSAAAKDAPDMEAAQQYHWDMERIRWLRFFIYLTDVGPENGPHCFIKGSHRTGAIPDDLLKLGYVRHSDETILGIYGKEAYCEFTGARGTIIAEDSRGFHKGKVLTKGDRLMISFEISNTLFGANKRQHIRNIRCPQLGAFARKYPRIYSNFDFEPRLPS